MGTTTKTAAPSRAFARGSARATPPSVFGHDLLTLQRQAGNTAVVQLLASGGPLFIQRKVAQAAKAGAAPRSLELSDAGVAFIAKWEGFRGRLYRDAAGLWTIGYGHLVKPGEMEKFRKGITEPQGRRILAQDAQIAVNGVRRLITASLNQTQFDVLVSFAFNVGVGALEESTLRRKLNAGNYGAVPSELRKWVNAGGRPVQGLVNRRNEEASLWRASGVPGGGAAKPQPEAAPARPTLRLGSRGPAVSRLQRALAAKGLSVGRADGIFGPRTRAAVIAFQRRRRLTPDGVVGTRTWRALSAGTVAPPAKPPASPKPPKPAARPVLRIGSRGPAVKDLQRLLAARGFSPGSADGAFGPRTQASLTRYQRSRGLVADGVAGAVTWKALQTNAPARPGPSGGSGDGGGGGGKVATEWVGGIQVATALAPNLRKLLAAAKRDGLTLTGFGYRSHARQIELRRQHCGPTHYDIWQKPSSQCNPPTAIPGRSMHETGLAIDFANCSSGSRVFGWLRDHAGRFGLSNLPSESWHWSTNGR